MGERGKDAKLCIIFSSAYFHPTPFLLPIFSFSLSVSFSSSFAHTHTHTQCFPTESDTATGGRGGLSGILGQIQTFLKVIFFNQRLLKDSSSSFVPSLNRSFPLSFSVLIFLTGDLSIPARSIFLCLKRNKVSDFRWRIQLISLGMHRLPAANASLRAASRNFHGSTP